MVFLWILLGLVGLLALVPCIPVGAKASWHEALKVDVKVGPFAFTVVPAPPKKKKKKPEKPPKAQKPKPPQKEKKPVPKPGFKDIRAALPLFWSVLQKTLRRTRRRICVSPLEASLVIGGDDLAETAQRYGYASTAVWTVMPRLEELMTIRHPHIHVGVDFTGVPTKAEGEIGFRFFVFDLVVIALGAGLPVWKWYRKWKKEHPAPSEKTAETGKNTGETAKTDGSDSPKEKETTHDIKKTTDNTNK